MPHPKVKISDDSGNTVDVDTSSNALHVKLVESIDLGTIGDVDVLSVIPGTGATNLGKEEDEPHSSGDTGVMPLAVRLDVAGTLAGTTGDYAPLQLNSDGELRVQSQIIATTGTSEAFASASATAASSQTGIVPLVKMNGVVSNPSGHADNEWTYFQTNLEGALYTTHGVTGGADGVTVVTTAGTDVVLGGDVSCQKVDIQAQTDNTGIIAVGFENVDATEATGTGVILYAGDTYSLEINNLNLIWIDSSEDGEGVRYTYFT